MKRVVTTNDASGRSRILIEEVLDAHSLIWETLPGEPLGRDPVPADHDLVFPKGGLQARYVEIPPDALLEDYMRRGVPGHDERGFHRTGTLDVLVLLEGRLKLILDEGEADLSPGDVVVQRDTNHAWRAGSEPARCLSVICRPQDLG